VVVQCTVTVSGRCGPVEVVDQAPGMPESARRFAKDSLARWVFEPQRVGGKPIETVVRVPIRIETRHNRPPKSFGKKIGRRTRDEPAQGEFHARTTA